MSNPGFIIATLAQLVTHNDVIVSDEQHGAMMHFFNVYMNTGADEDEAASMTLSTYIREEGNIDRIYFEALCYEDM